jgi:uncharacterized protein YigE (DUF2233 family)
MAGIAMVLDGPVSILELGYRDALFLDGDISQMAVEPVCPTPSIGFGAMFVVAE